MPADAAGACPLKGWLCVKVSAWLVCCPLIPAPCCACCAAQKGKVPKVLEQDSDEEEPDADLEIQVLYCAVVLQFVICTAVLHTWCSDLLGLSAVGLQVCLGLASYLSGV